MADFAYQVLFDGDPAPDDFYADVLELTIDERAADATVLKIRLAATLDGDGEWTHVDDDELALFAPISVKLGYLESGGVAGALSGAAGAAGNDGLVSVANVFVSTTDLKLGSTTGQTYFEITAVDASLLLGLEEKVAIWPNASDGEVIEQIARAYGLQTDVDTTPTVHQDNETLLVQRDTDLQFVRSLARRNGLEFAFTVDPKAGTTVAQAKAPQLAAAPQPDLAIQFGATSNLASFGVRADGRRPLTVKVTQTDVHAKSPNSAQVENISLTEIGADDLESLVGSQIDTLAPPADATSQLLLLGAPTSDSTEMQTFAQAARDEAGWFMTATGEVNCDVYGAVLRTRRTVLVKGAGALYSGKYYVTRVTHKVTSGGGYAQSFEARRNAMNLDGSEHFGGDDLAVSLPAV